MNEYHLNKILKQHEEKMISLIKKRDFVFLFGAPSFYKKERYIEYNKYPKQFIIDRDIFCRKDFMRINRCWNVPLNENVLTSRTFLSKKNIEDRKKLYQISEKKCEKIGKNSCIFFGQTIMAASTIPSFKFKDDRFSEQEDLFVNYIEVLASLFNKVYFKKHKGIDVMKSRYNHAKFMERIKRIKNVHIISAEKNTVDLIKKKKFDLHVGFSTVALNECFYNGYVNILSLTRNSWSYPLNFYNDSLKKKKWIEICIYNTYNLEEIKEFTVFSRMLTKDKCYGKLDDFDIPSLDHAKKHDTFLLPAEVEEIIRNAQS